MCVCVSVYTCLRFATVTNWMRQAPPAAGHPLGLPRRLRMGAAGGQRGLRRCDASVRDRHVGVSPISRLVSREAGRKIHCLLGPLILTQGRISVWASEGRFSTSMLGSYASTCVGCVDLPPFVDLPHLLFVFDSDFAAFLWNC